MAKHVHQNHNNVSIKIELVTNGATPCGMFLARYSMLLMSGTVYFCRERWWWMDFYRRLKFQFIRFWKLLNSKFQCKKKLCFSHPQLPLKPNKFPTGRCCYRNENKNIHLTFSGHLKIIPSKDRPMLVMEWREEWWVGRQIERDWLRKENSLDQ